MKEMLCEMIDFDNKLKCENCPFSLIMDINKEEITCPAFGDRSEAIIFLKDIIITSQEIIETLKA